MVRGQQCKPVCNRHKALDLYIALYKNVVKSVSVVGNGNIRVGIGVRIVNSIALPATGCVEAVRNAFGV